MTADPRKDIERLRQRAAVRAAAPGSKSMGDLVAELQSQLDTQSQLLEDTRSTLLAHKQKAKDMVQAAQAQAAQDKADFAELFKTFEAQAQAAQDKADFA